MTPRIVDHSFAAWRTEPGTGQSQRAKDSVAHQFLKWMASLFLQHRSRKGKTKIRVNVFTAGRSLEWLRQHSPQELFPLLRWRPFQLVERAIPKLRIWFAAYPRPILEQKFKRDVPFLRFQFPTEKNFAHTSGETDFAFANQ